MNGGAAGDAMTMTTMTMTTMTRTTATTMTAIMEDGDYVDVDNHVYGDGHGDG